MLKPRPIRTRLIQMQMLLASFVLVLSSLGYLINDVFIFRKAIERNLRSTASILERSLVAALAFGDKDEVSRTITSLGAEKAISAAAVLDNSGQIVASYGKVDSSIKASESMIHEQFKRHGTHLRIYFKLKDAGGSQGVLYIVADMLVFAEEYRSYVSVALIVLLVGLSISWVLSRLTHRSLSSPIGELAQMSRHISVSGDYSVRMPDQSKQNNIAEMVTLSQSFNQMLDKIEIQNKKIRQEKDLAESSNRTKSMFLANISHELRTPMHGILSFARFGQQKFETATKEKLRSYFDEIYQSGTQLMNLLNDLLDISKLEAGKVEYYHRDENILQLMKFVCAEMQAFAEEKNLTLQIATDCKDVVLQMDSDRMRQVFRNILSNAIKFSFEKSIITLSLRDRDLLVECIVENHGVGIPEAEKEAIFDKFIQSSKTRTGAGGTGLGLAICREIVVHHGGRIWAESEPDKTTRFIIELPKRVIKKNAESIRT